MTPTALKELEATLWKSADDLRANSDLKSNEYSSPVLGLIFLKFADSKYKQHEQAIKAEYKKLKGTRRDRAIEDIAIEKCGFYLPDEARYDYLHGLPEKENIAGKLKQAMKAIEKYKPELEGVLPKDEYFALTRSDVSIPNRLLKNFANIPDDADGDLFGQIYEYFLSEFALAEGQGGGEFFTPRSVVRLMVEIIEPHGGTVFDPACGSGGMFVQSARFVEEHRKALDQNAGDLDLYVCGQEKTLQTVKLARMNLAVNGLRGEIHQAISYYEDPAESRGKFDYVLANPPFNVDEVNFKRIENDPRFNTYGIPRRKTKGAKDEAGNETVPNANYLWINLFATSLKPKGRAALVMANSASDARHSEADIRRKLIEQNLIYGMLTLPSNMFYTVTLPATLWFFDKGKKSQDILFIDARNVFTQVDRAHREFSEAQLQNLATISRLHRGQRQDFVDLIDRYFADGMLRLAANAASAPLVAEKVRGLSEDQACKEAAAALGKHWRKYQNLHKAWMDYSASVRKRSNIEARNTAQRKLAQPFSDFFAELHKHSKVLDRAIHAWEQADAEKNGGKRRGERATRDVKAALDTLHGEIKDAELCFQHIAWLQTRFPEAKYEDVVGLCKRANRTEIGEQDWSLNPGRYVGVVIEEDGKAEEEFLAELQDMEDELAKLGVKSAELQSTVRRNVKLIVSAS